MRNEQAAVLASVQRAQQFLDAHGDILANVDTSIRQQLDDVAAQLSDLSVSQDAGIRAAKGETARKRALRIALRRHYMAPVADVAKLKLRAVPEFAALGLPREDVSLENEVTAAHAMADAASTHLEIFINNGLPRTFADDLRRAAVAISASIVDRSKHQGRRTGATAGLAAEERRGRAILKVLNSLIAAHAGNDAKLLAEWRTAKVVRRKPGPAAATRANDGVISAAAPPEPPANRPTNAARE